MVRAHSLPHCLRHRRCEKLATDDATSIYLPSILALDDDDAAIVAIKGVACHADALAVLVDTVAASDALDVSLVTRKTSFMTAGGAGGGNGYGSGGVGTTGSSRGSQDSSHDSLEPTPVWLREEFARAIGDNPGSAGATKSMDASNADLNQAKNVASPTTIDSTAQLRPSVDDDGDNPNGDNESSAVPPDVSDLCAHSDTCRRHVCVLVQQC